MTEDELKEKTDALKASLAVGDQVGATAEIALDVVAHYERPRSRLPLYLLAIAAWIAGLAVGLLASPPRESSKPFVSAPNSKTVHVNTCKYAVRLNAKVSYVSLYNARKGNLVACKWCLK